jgi:(S)-2-hydroxyglutarate dehydrogenase
MAASRKAFVRACAQYVRVIESMKIDSVAASGVRAQAVSRDGKLLDDFAISYTPGATHVRNARSPAATSSLALAKDLVDRHEQRSARRAISTRPNTPTCLSGTSSADNGGLIC